jgi:hypothetical protein
MYRHCNQRHGPPVRLLHQYAAYPRGMVGTCINAYQQSGFRFHHTTVYLRRDAPQTSREMCMQVVLIDASFSCYGRGCCRMLLAAQALRPVLLSTQGTLRVVTLYRWPLYRQVKVKVITYLDRCQTTVLLIQGHSRIRPASVQVGCQQEFPCRWRGQVHKRRSRFVSTRTMCSQSTTVPARVPCATREPGLHAGHYAG